MEQKSHQSSCKEITDRQRQTHGALNNYKETAGDTHEQGVKTKE
jgi:hypothetical protein